MAVPEQTPYIEHTGNGVTTSFALKFQCESKDHLIVLVDEIEPPIATWSLTGGNVVFTTAPAAGKKITAQRNTPFGRATNYQSFNNSFRPQTVNKDFDWIWWKLQELGVADWILSVRIDALKNYVDRKDDELKAYLMEEIRKQGVALEQLDEYYNYLMQRLAQIAVDKGWDASFVVDASGKNQQEINSSLGLNLSLQMSNGKTALECLEEISDISASYIRIPGGEYNLDGEVVFNSDIYLDCDEDTILNLGESGSLRFQGNMQELGVLRSDISKTTFSFTVDNASLVNQGDLLLIHNSQDFSFAPHRNYYRAGEFVRVFSRIGNVISIFGYPFDNYEANSTTKVYKVNPIHVGWNNLRIKASEKNNRPVVIDLGENINISKFQIDSSLNSAITVYRSYNVNTLGISSKNNGEIPMSSQTQYGVSFVNCQECNFLGGTSNASRHAVSITGENIVGPVNRNIKVSNATLRSFALSISAIDAHGNSEFITYDNCHANYAVLAGKNHTLSNCDIYSSKSEDGRCFYASEIVGGYLNLINNRYFLNGNLSSFGLIDLRPSRDLKEDLIVIVKNSNVFKLGEVELSNSADMVSVIPNGSTIITKKVSVDIDGFKIHFDANFRSFLNIGYVGDNVSNSIPTGYLSVDNVRANSTNNPYLIRPTSTAAACNKVYEMQQNGFETVTTAAGNAVTRNPHSMFKYRYSRKPDVFTQMSPLDSSISFDEVTFNASPSADVLRVPVVINGSSNNERCRPTVLWNKRIASGDGDEITIRLDWESVVNTM